MCRCSERSAGAFTMFRSIRQYALSQGGTLKVDELDRLPLLHIHRNQSKVRTTLHSVPRTDCLAFGRQHSGCPVHPHLRLTKFDRMKPQPTTPQVLQHLLLVQHGTIGSHQHVIVCVQPFKSNVVLLLQCTIESVRVDTQYLLCRHAISSLAQNFFHPVKSFAPAALTATALDSICGEEACGLFDELFMKLEVRAVPGIRVEDQPGIR